MTVKTKLGKSRENLGCLCLIEGSGEITRRTKESISAMSTISVGKLAKKTGGVHAWQL